MDPIDSAVPQSRVLELFSRKDRGIGDVIQYKGAKNYAMKYDGLLDDIRLVAESMEHITVNPKSRFKTFMLSNSYVYSHVEGLDAGVRGGQVVNRDANSVAKFINKLIDSANAEWVAAQNRNKTNIDRSDRVTYLIGEKGSGKTYFLNHAFSSYHSHLDFKKTIWVRINLSRDKGFDRNIIHWYKAQCAKIALRYYEHTSAFAANVVTSRVDIIGPLNEWARSISDERKRDKVQSEIDVIVSSLCTVGPDLPVSPSTFPEDIVSRVFSIVHAMGFRFVIIMDGYDRLDCDRYNRSRFKAISAQLRTLTTGTTRLGIALLIVCRTETFAKMSNAFSLSSDRPYKTVFLAACPFDNIVSQRLDRLIDWFDHELTTLSGEDAERKLRSREICIEFKDEFIRRVNEGRYEDLTDLFQYNSRACVQMLAAEFIEFSDSNNDVPGYKILESITLAGAKYPPIIYNYTVKADNCLDCDYNDEEGRIPFDTRFLPCLTRPPVPRRRGKYVIGGYYIDTSPLHGIRLLQILAAARGNRDRGSDGVSISALKSFLSTAFGYHPAVTEALCWEYEAYGCVYIDRDNYESIETDEDDSIILMPKGQTILTRTLPDPAYLNLCAMRLLAGIDFLQDGAFDVASLEFLERDRSAAITKWINAKIKNSLGMARLLVALNLNQREQWLAQSREAAARILDFDVGDFEQGFGYIDESMNRTMRMIALIYRSYTEATIDEGLSYGLMSSRDLETKLKASLLAGVGFAKG